VKLFVVIGLGQFGYHTAHALAQGGAEVIAIDRDERRVAQLKDMVAQAICMDSTNEDALRAVGAHKTHTAILALGEKDLEASILTCAALHDLGVGQIVVRASNMLQGRILKRVGATKLVFPEKVMGEHIATSLMMSGVIDQVTLSTGQTVAQILPTDDLVGKRLMDAKLRERFRINVIGIIKRRQRIDDNGQSVTDEELVSTPAPDDVIEENDVLVIVGFQSQIEHVARKD